MIGRTDRAIEGEPQVLRQCWPVKGRAGPPLCFDMDGLCGLKLDNGRGEGRESRRAGAGLPPPILPAVTSVVERVRTDLVL